jgi:hypothetical protein
VASTNSPERDYGGRFGIEVTRISKQIEQPASRAAPTAGIPRKSYQIHLIKEKKTKKDNTKNKLITIPPTEILQPPNS